MKKETKWAIIGLGFISQRHIDAIKDIGGKIIAGCDIDVEKHQKLPKETAFFDHFKDLIESEEFKEVEWVSVCTPNHLHYVHVMVCIEKGKKVICEKPLVTSVEHFNKLEDVANGNLFPVLQLRHNPELQEIKEWIDKERPVLDGELTLKMHRGAFYWKGWKGDDKKSGGILFNIGVHYFDLLFWFFGQPVEWKIETLETDYAKGKIWFPNANIKWELSLKAPMDNQFRKFVIGEREIDLTRHFENLHTKVYQDALEGKKVPLSEIGRTIKQLIQMN